MGNSPLVSYTKISPNKTKRYSKITKITIHHMAGNLSVEACGNAFATTDRQASSNYGIGTDGRVGLYVPEDYRAWTSSNRNNDEVAVTIEVANDVCGGNWHVSDKALEALIALCTDICLRNGISELVYTGDATGNLTRHNMFTSTQCPGAYLQSKFPTIAEEVNKRIKEQGGTSQPTDPDEGNTGSSGSTENKVLYKVQVGAYDSERWACVIRDRLKAYGYDAVVVACNTGSNTGCSDDEPSGDTKFEVGDVIKLTDDAAYFDGREIPSWVFGMTLYVRQIYYNGDIVFSAQKEGAITGIINPKYAIKV